MEEMLIIEIHDGRLWHTTKRNRKLLRSRGMEFCYRARGGSYWKKTIPASQLQEWKALCRNRHLKLISYSAKLERNKTYRKDFLDSLPGDYAFCGYCGKLLLKDDLTVDHIVPVAQAKYSKTARGILRILGTDDVNNPKNLVCACHFCNSKKGKKMGIWEIRGFLGKSKLLWYIRWVFRIGLFIALIWFAVVKADLVHTIPAVFHMFSS